MCEQPRVRVTGAHGIEDFLHGGEHGGAIGVLCVGGASRSVQGGGERQSGDAT